ncbi:MAG: hypothetical protein ABOK23_09610 [Candidatus Methanoperedens sp.]|nr:hypothetical protein [Candidatus Methanoperedens sp.]
MMVSPYCEKHDMALRLLTQSHRERRHEDDCESVQCEQGAVLFKGWNWYKADPSRMCYETTTCPSGYVREYHGLLQMSLCG